MAELRMVASSPTTERCWGDTRRTRRAPGTVGVAGTRLTVRESRPFDRAHLRAFYEGLSEDSRYKRFLQPMPRVPEAVLDVMADSRHVGLLALDGDEVVAEALLVPGRADPTGGEIAYAVADRLHRQGLGRQMVCRLLGSAAAAGICRVHAVISPENRASAGLMRSLGARLHLEDGLLIAELLVCDAAAAA
jgi:RimJ/RimL family protein N-acetyltransferase